MQTPLEERFRPRTIIALLSLALYFIGVWLLWPAQWSEASRLCPEWGHLPGCTPELARAEIWAYGVGLLVLSLGLSFAMHLLLWARREDNVFSRFWESMISYEEGEY